MKVSKKRTFLLTPFTATKQKSVVIEHREILMYLLHLYKLFTIFY
jgi:hypothetical protein